MSRRPHRPRRDAAEPAPPVERPARVAPAVRGAIGDRSGAAAVEFALVLPMLLLLLAGLVDVSRAILTSLRAEAAAQAGVDYAASHGWDAIAIANAATAATPLTVSVRPSRLSACASSLALQPEIGTTCANGDPAGVYVMVVVQTAFSPLVPWPGIAGATTFSSSAVVRIS